MKLAERKPSVLLKALVWGLGAMIVAGAFGWLLGGPFGALAAGAFGFLGGYGISRPLIADQYLFEGGLSANWTGIQAFNREYARSRGLERQKIFQFHHDYRGLPVPGRRRERAGRRGTRRRRAGAVRDARRLTRAASERTALDDENGRTARLLRRPDRRPLPRARALRRRSARAARRLRVALMNERTVVVSRPIDGNLTRTLEGCDEFRHTAGEMIARLMS